MQAHLRFNLSDSKVNCCVFKDITYAIYQKISRSFSDSCIQSRRFMLNFHVGNLASLVDNVSSFIMGTNPVEIPLDTLVPPVHTLSKSSIGVEVLKVHFFAITSSDLVELCFRELVDVELHL